ncbi:tape measure protein [Acinetobacter variabilis]|uniref:tape measure protein n=1 Tax=Acinetobacter variabilis TaxID=70346 RepID=UPI003B968A7A
MSGKNLTFKLVMDADTKAFVSNMHQSEKAAKDAFAALKNGSTSVVGDTNSATKEVDQLGTQSQETAQQVKQLDKELEATSQELQQTEQSSKGVSGELQGLKTGFNALTGALAALGIGTTAMEIAQTADEYKNLSGRLSIAIGEHGNLQKAMDDVKNVAINTNSNLTATGDLYARLTKIGQEMKWPQEQALALTETINKATQVGGGSAAANEAAITQLNQALGSGVLRGDEFNSMMEQSPRLTQALADGLGVTTGKLREMAGEGQLTTDVVTKALLSQSEVISAEFAKFPTTIGASIENLKTAWTVYIGEADAASGASAKVAEAIKFVAQNLDLLVTALTTAAQAYIAYKALGMSAALLEKANSARMASAAIQQETTTIVTNTQAQIANANATKVAALAKTQLTTATNASTVANAAAAGGFSRVTTAANGLKTGLVSVLSRFGAYGVAAAGIVVAGDLIIDSLKKTDEWLIRQGSNFIDWAVSRTTGTKSLVEQEKEFIETEEASRKKQEEVAAAKAKNAERTEMLRNASLGLNEVSKATVLEFDKQVEAGKKVSEALDGVAKSFNFDSATGINNGITALLALQTQGKASGEEIRKALTGILKDEDLIAFQGRLAAIPVNIEKQIEATNTKIKAKQVELDAWKKANQDASWNDWKATTDKYRADIEKLQAESSALQVQYANSIKGAAMVQGAVLDEAIRRTGLSYEELSGKSTKAFASAKNDVRVLIDNLDGLKSKGVDVGRVLDVSISKAINTTTNQQELEDLKAKINSLRDVLGSKVADGLLRQAEQQLIDLKDKADQARAGINSVQEAFNLFGMKTPAQLKVVAQEYKQAFEEMKNSGQATLSQQRDAFKQYAEKAIAANKGVADSVLLSQANMLGLKIETDEAGKTAIKSMDDWTKSNDRVKNSARGIGDGYRHAGQIAREEAKSSTEAWADAVSKAKSDFNKEMKRQGEALSKGIYEYDSYTKSDVISQLKSKGYDDKEAEKLASTIWSKAMAADRDAKAEGLGKESSVAMKALINAEFDRAAANGITTQHGTNKINELLRSINVASTGSGSLGDYAPSIPSVSSNAATQSIKESVNYNIQFGGQTLSLTGDASQKDVMTSLVNQLKGIAKST